MTTRINLFDHSSGLRDTVEISLPRDLLIHRLQAAIGKPSFELDDDGEVSVYARVDCKTVAVHVFSYPYNSQAASARWNEILNTLTKKAVV